MNLLDLPDDLPAPIDDGDCDHLVGMSIPSVKLMSTKGRLVDVASLPGPRAVIYCYPMTGVPGKAIPDGWDTIPGARGCTPQSCTFRDHHRKLLDLGAHVFGLSTQTTSYQQEMVDRLHLPFEVLSDAELLFAKALRLPRFDVEGMTLIKRLILIVRGAVIEHVFYPVFPPTESAETVVAWLQQNRPRDRRGNQPSGARIDRLVCPTSYR